MKKLSLLAALATAVVLVLASYASGSSATGPTFKLTAVLNAAQEVPHAKGAMSGAVGHFTATLANGTLKWHLTFSHLTGPATASHIHVGVKGKSGAVLVSLCGPCKSGASGTEKLPNPAAFTVEKHGATYVNVHTAKNPNGEIRGQVIVTP
jgi:CHRD domain